MTLTRRRFWTSALGAGATGALYARVVEPKSLRVTRTSIAIPNLDAPMRIAQLSDLHSSPDVETSLLEEAATLAIEARPDIICLTGDYITGPDKFDSAGLVRIFRRLSAAAPVFSILGNHDLTRGRIRRTGWGSDEVLDLLREGGTNVLHNKTEVIHANGQRLALTGIGDLWRNEFQPHRAFAKVDENIPVVFLCHNPDGKDAALAYRWDLMLSGHTHGGQVVLPFLEPTWAPVADKRFIAGRYDWEGRQMFITRGVGSIRGLRFSCPPEVSILDLHG